VVQEDVGHEVDADGMLFHGLLLKDRGSLWYPKRGWICKAGIEKARRAWRGIPVVLPRFFAIALDKALLALA
jgi:hypothetical protein